MYVPNSSPTLIPSLPWRAPELRCYIGRTLSHYPANNTQYYHHTRHTCPSDQCTRRVILKQQYFGGPHAAKETAVGRACREDPPFRQSSEPENAGNRRALAGQWIGLTLTIVATFTFHLCVTRLTWTLLRSLSSSEPPRTSSASASGSRTRATPSSPLLTRRARTPSSTRSSSMLKSSLPHRECFFLDKP